MEFFIHKEINMRQLFLCIYLFFFSFDIQPLIAAEKFKFADLAHEEKDPETYTLMCLDSSLIPASQKVDDFTKRKEFNPVKTWLRKELLEKLEESDEDDESPKELSVDTQKHGKGSVWYLVSLYDKPRISPSEHLTARLLKKAEKQEVSESASSIYSASMFIFPQSGSTYSLVYLLGNWSQLLNPYTVIHDWGLRLAASQTIFSDKNIKQILGKNNFDPNPTTRREKKQRLGSIETFVLEVGTEGLQSLTILPAYAKGTDNQRLVVGSDWYKFFLPKAGEEGKGDTINSLVKMANYLFDIYTDNLVIHPKLQAYLDEQENDTKKIGKLNEQLAVVLSSADTELKVFPADNIWKSYGRGASFSYKKNKRMKHLLKALEGQNPTLDSLITIKKWGKEDEYQEPLGRIIYSLPIEFEKEFYRFDRGRWFKVASSRFGAIIKKMRSPSVKVSLDALVPYTLEDAEGAQGKDKLYQEARYNRRVVAQLTGKKHKGILLDRLNIYFEGTGNNFEFGDMLLYDDKKQYYIVHVKRREAGDIDHHRAQVERCAEYLATELKKENAKTLLLQGCVNQLYMQHDISINKAKGQGKRLTHGNYFEKAFAAAKRAKKETWDDYLKKKVFSGKDKTVNKLREALKEIDLNSFETHLDELIVALDALYDCVQEDEDTGITKEQVEEFLEAIKQLIEVQNILFPSGVLEEKTRKKITIVMAIVDDRKIEVIRQAHKDLEKAKQDEAKAAKTKAQTKGKVAKDGKKTLSEVEKATKKVEELKKGDRSKEEEVFKKQQLWGLDRTLQLVQKHGFKFNLTIINENTDRENWDAFGSTEEDVVPEDTSDEDSGEEDEATKKAAPKKQQAAKKAVGKKKSSEEDDTTDDEDILDVSHLFKSAKKLGKSATLDLQQSQKITTNALIVNAAQGIYGEYVSCPTFGDGDCFFHAIFTQNGEDRSAVRERSSAMRTALCDVVPADEYLTGCRNIVYEEYLRMSTTSKMSSIPEPMRTRIRENHDHTAARNYVRSILPAGQALPAILASEYRHNIDTIKGAIPVEEVTAYMERFRTRAGADSYIPVRPGMTCPAEKLALQNNVRVNIFTFNKDHGWLDLLKTVGVLGDDGDNPIYNILLEGAHYVALINPAESDERKQAVKQIMKNAGLYT